METLTEKVRSGSILNTEDVAAATAALLDEAGAPESKAEFLKAFSTRGEKPEEIALFVEEFLKHAVDPGIDKSSIDEPLIDVCGTGGDKLGLFNVSTTVTFVLAGGGAKVVKHGNRGITSKSGGADVLEALGVKIDLAPDRAAACLDECGTVFLFAPIYHPAFKAVAPVRQLLAKEGVRTMFNLLGPLLNPARPDYQLVGVFGKEWTGPFADILGRVGRKRAWAVHGEVGDGRGMDEVSTLGMTYGADSIDGITLAIDPKELGIEKPNLEELVGGEAEENAEILTAILDGTDRGPKRDMVVLNTAAAFMVTGLSGDPASGIERAKESIDSGAALDSLRKMQAFSAST
ncbi:MAG: anthranilate phosphoribosyltransferase [Verrucomicrobiota bacterium]